MRKGGIHMRKTAGFLKVCCTIVMVFMVIAAMALTAGLVVIALSASFSELAAQSGNAITISGGEMTPAEMDALKPVILGVLAAGLIGVILSILGALKTRAALTECKEERPFSQKCIDSFKSAARYEVIAGLVGIASSLVMSFMASNLTVAGTKLGGSTTTFSLTFVLYAVMKYLAYHVASYGHTLERDPRRR